MLLASNARHAVTITTVDTAKGIDLTLNNVNITGHWYASAMFIAPRTRIAMSMEKCNAWENYNGVIDVARECLCSLRLNTNVIKSFPALFVRNSVEFAGEMVCFGIVLI